MTPSLWGILCLLVVVFLPGVLLFLALRPRGGSLECLALAPPLSLAVVHTLGQISNLTGLPFGPITFVPTLGLLGAAAAIRLRRAAPPGRVEDRTEALMAHRQAAILLLAGMLLSVLTWGLGLGGAATTPPNRDSANHGFMAAQIARLSTMEPSEVLTSDVLGTERQPTGETTYYPLALHGEVALVYRIGGVPIAEGLLALTMIFSAVVLPLGLFLMSRRLVPEKPLVAGLAGLLTASLGCLPLGPVYFGGLTVVVGLAMVPGLSVVAARHLIEGDGAFNRWLVALAAVGIAATHTSEVPLVAMFTGALVVQAVVRARRTLLVAGVVKRAVFLALSCTFLMLPSVGALLGGTAERSGFDESPVISVAAAIRGFFTVISFPSNLEILVLLAAAGFGLCLWKRQQFPMVFVLVAALGLYVIAASFEGPLQILTLPWYHHPARLAFNAALLLPFFGALALDGFGALVAQLFDARPARNIGALTVIVMAALLGVVGVVNHSADMRAIFDRHALVDEDAVAAFAYLGEAVGSGERVLNDANNDGGLWMYAFSGVPPVLGLSPFTPGKSWLERTWLLENLPKLGTDPKVASLLEEQAVRFVYLDDRNFDRFPHLLTVEALRGTPGVCERLSRGTSHVFEVVPRGDCGAPA